MESKCKNQDQSPDNRIDNEEYGIDLVEILKKLWNNRKLIIIITIAFSVLGFVVAISTSNIYTASCTMVPQTGQKSTGGSLGGLAAMAGINLGNLSSGELLSPTVYPKIMTNINFQKEIIYSKFHFNDVKEPITLYDYYTLDKYQKFSLLKIIKKYTIGLPGVILGAIKGDQKDINQSDNSSLQSFTSKEKDVVKIVNSNLSLIVNNKDGFVSIIANMPEPLLAAELVHKGQELLQKYITEFKIEKVASNLRFVEKSYDEAKKNFELKQSELARFRDSNKSFTSAVAKTQEEKLMSEYTLLLGIYTELSKQKEQAKISVTETTPILTVIEPVFVPFEKSKPNRVMMIFVFSIFGLLVGIGLILAAQYFQENFISNIKNNRFITKII